MPVAVTAGEWLVGHIPHYEEDGVVHLRWTNRNGNAQEAVLDDVVSMFGATIEGQLTVGGDVVAAVLAGSFSEAWKDIWHLWREYGWV